MIESIRMKLNRPKIVSVKVFVVLCFTVLVALKIYYATIGYDNATLEVRHVPFFIGNSDADLVKIKKELKNILGNNDTDLVTIKKELKNILGKSDADLVTIKKEVKNILMWTHDNTEPFMFLKQGRELFMNCQINNCYLTRNKGYLNNLTRWDALLFHAKEYTMTGNSYHHPLPQERSAHQEYVFVSIESSSNYPLCDAKWENYFNLTMTYMLDSGVPWEYLDIREKETNSLVGPGDVKWKDDMQNVTEEVKRALNRKTKPAAWFVSNCYSIGKREVYVKELRKEMTALGMALDVYGGCGELSCPKSITISCEMKLRKEYKFYLAFENTFNTDYVTEKLLRAMQNDVVPIVWGGANYSRFAPPNSYIDARRHSPRALAELIHRLMHDIDGYAEFFKWKQYYTYHSVFDSYETHPLCRLCKALNDPDKTRPRIKENFSAWWNGDQGSKACGYVNIG